MLPDADGADAGGQFPAARRNRTIDCVHALMTPLGRTVDGRLGMIHADERKVKQVLSNLLSNALKFNARGRPHRRPGRCARGRRRHFSDRHWRGYRARRSGRRIRVIPSHMRYPSWQAGNANDRFQTCKEVCEGALLCCRTGGNGSNCDCRPSNRLHSDSTVAERPTPAVPKSDCKR
jgi:hypothetical protein